MSKRLISLLIVLGLFATTSSVAAAVQWQSNALSTPGVERTLVLPAAADKSPVISLGQAVDPGTGKMVEGYAFVHYKDEKAKGGNKNKGPKGGGGDVCYSFLASGAKWKDVGSWVVDPSNENNLSEDFIFQNLKDNIAKWENEAGEVGSILGEGILATEPLEADTVTPDGVNEVYFGAIDSPNAIAVTIVWGVFRGRPSQRYLVEWDQVYNEAFDWSNNKEAETMDFENIATHELGHAVGLGHPSDSCVEETMYRYAKEGETNKSTLEAGDIAGIKALY